MKWLGYKQVKYTSIDMDVAEIRRRAKQANVSDLAANIREHGDEPIHAPTVRVMGKKRRLLCGRDRMAALLSLKAKKLWVRLAECSDTEAADLEASENIHRRSDDRGDVLAKAVAAKELLLADRKKLPPLNSASSDPETTAGKRAITAEARKQVARDAGVSVRAVRQAQQRVATAAAPPEPAALPEPTLNLLGVDDEGARAIMHLALSEQAAIDEADKHLRLAQTALARLSRAAVQQELKEQVRRVASMVRAERPAAICPWCKGLPSIPKCGPCDTFGYVKAEKAERAPRELLGETPLVAIDGVFYPYAEVRDGKLPAKNGEPANRARGGIKVETTDGVTHDLAVEMDDEQAY